MLLGSNLLSELKIVDMSVEKIKSIKIADISIANPVINPNAEDSMFCKNVLDIKSNLNLHL